MDSRLYANSSSITDTWLTGGLRTHTRTHTHTHSRGVHLLGSSHQRHGNNGSLFSRRQSLPVNNFCAFPSANITLPHPAAAARAYSVVTSERPTGNLAVRLPGQHLGIAVRVQKSEIMEAHLLDLSSIHLFALLAFFYFFIFLLLEKKNDASNNCCLETDTGRPKLCIQIVHNYGLQFCVNDTKA